MSVRAARNAQQYEEAILKEIVELAETYDVTLRTAVRADIVPDEAILKQIARRRSNLVAQYLTARLSGCSRTPVCNGLTTLGSGAMLARALGARRRFNYSLIV